MRVERFSKLVAGRVSIYLAGGRDGGAITWASHGPRKSLTVTMGGAADIQSAPEGCQTVAAVLRLKPAGAVNTVTSTGGTLLGNELSPLATTQVHTHTYTAASITSYGMATAAAGWAAPVVATWVRMSPAADVESIVLISPFAIEVHALTVATVAPPAPVDPLFDATNGAGSSGSVRRASSLLASALGTGQAVVASLAAAMWTSSGGSHSASNSTTSSPSRSPAGASAATAVRAPSPLALSSVGTPGSGKSTSRSNSTGGREVVAATAAAATAVAATAEIAATAKIAVIAGTAAAEVITTAVAGPAHEPSPSRLVAGTGADDFEDADGAAVGTAAVKVTSMCRHSWAVGSWVKAQAPHSTTAPAAVDLGAPSTPSIACPNLLIFVC
jgi:hypothetical protein